MIVLGHTDVQENKNPNLEHTHMKLLLPHPGGPWSKYPLLYGIPAVKLGQDCTIRNISISIMSMMHY